jgi:cell wall-associated NlpC family hydrolase
MHFMEARQAIVNEAMTWLRTPYHHAAGIKGAGVDCAQILIEVYSSVGLTDKPDVGYYPSDWMLHRSEERYLGWIEKYASQVDTPAMGDVVLFKFGRCFSHSGIVVNYPTIIHAQREDGCCYADATKGALAGREVRFYSLFHPPVKNGERP